MVSAQPAFGVLLGLRRQWIVDRRRPAFLLESDRNGFLRRRRHLESLHDLPFPIKHPATRVPQGSARHRGGGGGGFGRRRFQSGAGDLADAQGPLSDHFVRRRGQTQPVRRCQQDAGLAQQETCPPLETDVAARLEPPHLVAAAQSFRTNARRIPSSPPAQIAGRQSGREQAVHLDGELPGIALLALRTGVGTSQLDQGALQAKITVATRGSLPGRSMSFGGTIAERSLLEGPSICYATRRTARSAGIAASASAVAVRRRPGIRDNKARPLRETEVLHRAILTCRVAPLGNLPCTLGIHWRPTIAVRRVKARLPSARRSRRQTPTGPSGSAGRRS